ncbi:hypothetical protein HHI36_004308 [Cryptolaemus montrouzieri]|uniref:Uncharacterized protein n=1 Tax=Cryptolaemus montrouzieri TaxID=559131 RepID=A0ABD2NR36_9CUCU
MIITIIITVSVTLWCLFSFALYGYHYILEVILDLPIVGESPCSAHSALKKIVQKIIREANDLPELKSPGTNNALEQEGRTYEDLLSTAILNKIISSSQNSINGETACSSRANSVCSHRSSASSRRRRLQKEYFFGEETLENKWKNIDTDTASVSSLEEWVHSDSSLGSTKYVDKVSLTIKQRIEEVSSSESEAEESLENDDVEYFRSNSAFGNDEPNWFLQRKQFRPGSNSPVPVPMLVPDPTSEAKVLIGDQEIDDTSDLSDVLSDCEEQTDRVSLMGVKNHLVDSRTAIGGKNPLADLQMGHFSDGEVSADSGVKDDVDSEKYSTSNKHEHEYIVDASISSEGSHIEKDTEYTERYATLPRTILISPQDNSRLKGNLHNGSNEQQNRPDNVQKNDFEEESDGENQPNVFTGVYSSREKEKWKHAVELKNNPYSKENIEKRIKSRNSINSLFGSDYYIRQASLPSGAKKSEIKNFEFPTKTEVFQTQDPLNETEEHAIEENSDENHVTEHVQLTSTPIKDPKTCENFQNSISDSEIHFSSEITSDSDVSLVNCYDVTESVIYRKLSAEDEEIQTAEKVFDFESLEVASIPEQKTEEPNKPIAKPRKKVTEEMIERNKMQIDHESDVKLVKYKEIHEDNFDAIPYIINKRSDNTLIKKIYSDPSVRSFALSNRNKLPITEINKPFIMKTKSIEEIKTEDIKPKRSSSKNIRETNGEVEVKVNLSEIKLLASTQIPENTLKAEEKIDDQLECFYAQAVANGSSPNKNLNAEYEALEEINKLKEQKLVANRLKQFSKSSTNLSTICDDILSEEDQDVNLGTREPRRLSGLQNGERSTSVKDLMKKFEQFDINSKSEKPIMYSLTGRSISKQFKERLRGLNEDTPSLSQIHSLSLTNLDLEENSR